MKISETIQAIRKSYIDQGLANSYAQINSGQCENFAIAVVKQLGGESDALYLVGVENFMTKENLWDWELLANHWNILPPKGMSAAEVDGLKVNLHIWITDGKKHYDSECPDGVVSFFDLPIYQRSIN